MSNLYANKKDFSIVKRLTSIQYKIFIFLITLSLITAFLVGGTAFYSMQDIEKSAIDVMMKNNENLYKLMVQKQSGITREILDNTQRSVNIISENLAFKNSDNKKLYSDILKSINNHTKYIDSVYIATTDGKMTIFSKDPNHSLDKSYNPLQREWYQNAVASKKLVWSGVYQDAGPDGKRVITCSKVFYNAQGKIAGVIGADLLFDVINKNIFNIKIGVSDYYFLIDGDGYLIARPEISKTDLQWDEILSMPLDSDLHQIKDNEFQGILKEIIDKNDGFVEWHRADKKDKFIAFYTTTSTNLTLGLVVSKSDIETQAKAVFIQEIKEVGIHLFIIFPSIILLIILISIISSKRITQPIKILKDGVNKIGSGNLTFKVELKTGDELEQLADEFNKMGANLQHYIDDLEKTTKQKQHIESELNIAARIQRDMLPMIFPAYPERQEIDIFASMSPAKQVGGDFYDFFLINPNKLCFVIGDVSGKGIPAALFMVISKTLLKSEAMMDISPAEILYNVNNSLNSGNDEMMFVTVLLCILDLTTGEVEFANGGHNPPLIMKKDHNVDFITLNKAKILGVFPNALYSNQKLVLANDEILFLYTDGVTEAMDINNNQFSEKTLHKTISGLQGLSVEKIEGGILKAVKKFVKEAEQSDDITILVAQYRGKIKSESIENL
jgi:sigma-B regulation protein RsbU (phosphoserine phosphatase)